jgi:phosphocarrier protein HPr
MACGLPNFANLKRKLLLQLSGRLALGSVGRDLSEIDVGTFDAVWSKAHPADRRDALQNVMPQRGPGPPGYYALSELIKRETFRLVINYNIDTYLEDALHSVGCHNFLLLINGCHEDTFVKQSLEKPRLRTILKTHGDYRHGFYAFTGNEMLDCSQRLSPILPELTKRDLLIVGYSGNDYPFMRTVDCTNHGGTIWFANPSPPPDYLKHIMEIRGSSENIIPAGFDDFFRSLEALLRRHSADKLSAPKETTDSTTASAKVIMLNKLGLHARSAAMIVKIANRFKCNVFVEANGARVNAKSILALLMLAIQPKAEIIIMAEGQDAKQAVEEIKVLFARRFDVE